ncbi:MAG: DUF2207 domain-containing protein [Eubacterium sp.]
MKKKCLTLIGILFTLCLVLPGAAFAEEYYTTPDYKVEMIVNEDQSYAITETITVSFTEPRHGIYRYIPKQGSLYREIDGKAIQTPFTATISRVSVEGYDYETSTEDGNLVIKIGNADELVDGRKTYIIHYTWAPKADGITTFDDVYYNILPHNWPTPIDQASFSIQMPKAFDASQLNVYAGEYGAIDAGTVTTSVNGNTITGQSTKALATGEGITVNLRLPEGYFVGVWTGTEGLPFLYGTCAICLIAGILLFFILGRNPKPVEVVNFYPPHDFTPPQIGTIIDGKTDRKDLIAVIMYLADKGYLTIEATGKKDFTFHQIKHPKFKDEPDFIREIFTGIFPSTKTESVTLDSLKGVFYTSIDAATAMVEGYFEDPEHQLFTKTAKLVRLGLLALMAIVGIAFGNAGSIASTGQFDIFEALFYVVFSIGLPIIGFYYIYQTAVVNKKGANPGRRGFKALVGAFFTFIALSLSLALNELPDTALLTVYGTILLLGFLLVLPKRRTEIGNQWLGETLGFKNFIVSAEADRIKMLVDENPQYFYNILPYAYVLGITDKWAKNFEGLAIEPPNWYYGYSTFDTFDCLLFASMMNHNMRSMTNDMIHVPSDSGSGGFGDSGFGGGGGFSGGGGGGGGGGSW